MKCLIYTVMQKEVIPPGHHPSQAILQWPRKNIRRWFPTMFGGELVIIMFTTGRVK